MTTTTVYLEEVLNRVHVGIEGQNTQRRGQYIGIKKGTPYKICVKNDNAKSITVDVTVEGRNIGVYLANANMVSCVEKDKEGAPLIFNPDMTKKSDSCGLISITTHLQNEKSESKDCRTMVFGTYKFVEDPASKAMFHMRLVEMAFEPDVMYISGVKSTPVPPMIKNYMTKTQFASSYMDETVSDHSYMTKK